MPKLEPKMIQKELDQGQLRPVYWVYGSERMKVREIVKRIRKAVLGPTQGGESAGGLSLSEDVFEASETDASSVLDAAQSMSLMGGTRLVTVRDAHALKNPETLEPLLDPAFASSKENLVSVCVFISKDLDGRKKFSKTLLDRAAVIPCEEVQEGEREPWIQYLAKLKGVKLSAEHVLQLSLLDPWNLEIVDQELEKYVTSGADEEAFLKEMQLQGGNDVFIDAFFRRNRKVALERAERFADQPDESLPLLGLLAWNAKQLALTVADKQSRSGTLKLSPFIAERMRVWSQFWSMEDVIELQAELAGIDFGFKQTPLLALGLWDSLVLRFCRKG